MALVRVASCHGYNRFRLEKVGFQVLSLRQSLAEEHSLIPSLGRSERQHWRRSRNNLPTAPTCSTGEILSLGPFLSKPPHFAGLVRFM